jgi:hypothetical protein
MQWTSHHRADSPYLTPVRIVTGQSGFDSRQRGGSVSSLHQRLCHGSGSYSSLSLSLSLLRLRTVQVNISVTEEVALAGFLRVLLFSPVHSTMLRTYLHPHFSLTRRTNGRSLGTFRISEGTEERNAQSDVYSAMVTCGLHKEGEWVRKQRYWRRTTFNVR